jgi:hypothetical protein
MRVSVASLRNMNRLRAYTEKAAIHRNPVGKRLRLYSEKAAESWWRKLTKEAQDLYLRLHKRSKLKPTPHKPPRQPQSSTPEYDPTPPGQDPFQKQQDITHPWLEKHIKKTLSDHGITITQKLIKYLRKLFIGALLAMTSLSNAYAMQPSFDPSAPPSSQIVQVEKAPQSPSDFTPEYLAYKEWKEQQRKGKEQPQEEQLTEEQRQAQELLQRQEEIKRLDIDVLRKMGLKQYPSNWNAWDIDAARAQELKLQQKERLAPLAERAQQLVQKRQKRALEQ